MLIVIMLLSLAAISIPTSAEETSSFPGIKDDFFFGSAENDIYAIANDGNVWHWNGAWWWQVTSGRFIEKRIHVESKNVIYGLSRDSYGHLEILKWNGEHWAVLTRNGAVKDDFWFISENEIYIIGENNQVYLWNGQEWRSITSGHLEIIEHIQVVSENQIYGISTQHELLKWNGADWVPIIVDGKILDFFVLKSETELYAINSDQTICLWNGNLWESISIGNSIIDRIYVNSPTEIYGLGSDQHIWQWNGEKWIKITDSTTINFNELGSTFYRTKFLGGILESQPAIIAFKNRIVIVGEGREGSVYAREWAPLRMESWDSCRNGQFEGLTDWISLNAIATGSPELAFENGNLYVFIKAENGGIYKKQYYSLCNWSSWELTEKTTLIPGPFSSAGFTIIASNKNGYPSEVSLMKFKSFDFVDSKPKWIEDLVIYEIATKEYTSPDGMGTGTFRALCEKLDYIKELGATAIWLSGHSWSDPRHFGNVYTQYANIHPGMIEPSLGSVPDNVEQTEQEFKLFIDEAHNRGIKVILDLIPHGVMSYSPLVLANQTPSYVPSYPTQLNITPHPDWFGAITNPSYEEIPIAKENRSVSTRMIDFVGGYEQVDLDDWWVEICTDYVLDFGVDGFRIDLGSSRFDLWARIKENARMAGHEIIIIPEGDPDDYPFEVGIYDFEQLDSEWTPFSTPVEGRLNPSMGITVDDMKEVRDQVLPKLSRRFFTIPISVHDSLFYKLKGSRFKMGYGAMFTPFIPMFMSGEEFDAIYSPVPNSNSLWLLTSGLNWDELNQPDQESFYEDIKKAIKLRHDEPALHYFANEAKNANVVVLNNFISSLDETPSPYLRFLPNSSETILIVGNNNSQTAATVTFEIPLDQFDLESFKEFEVVDLWSGKVDIVSLEKLDIFSVVVEPDNFRIFRITSYTGIPNELLFFIIAPIIIIIILVVFVILLKGKK